ncbi:DUF2961 domain-containing protein [Fulvivirgaceae bacterium BMA12]|uniref:DUF2961 domain-containing protein n=1 Tax=Agaribacillus aureus TaxID=3051825 RepID=A0ABT8L0Y3_9BACT|nr:DUF2961 domain-containing protein [Fulvivirgaceae bacterium BMA12]
MNRFSLLLLLTIIFTDTKGQVITITSLLEEMIDRNSIAQFPEVAYQCKQASSYNRESESPNLPGWFADSDGEGFIRTEEINGQKEWVLMEDEGPGVITKIWAVCFYYGLQDTTGANIKFYLDGAAQPAISANFFKLVKGQDFIKPPFADESTRAGNLYFPIPYARSCKITMDKKAFYNIINYRKYPAGTPIKTFTMEDFEAAKLVRDRVAHTLSIKPDAKGKVIKQQKRIDAGAQMSFQLPKGNRAVKQIEIKLNDHNPADLPQLLRSVVLSAAFDGIQTVWVPLGDFFNNVGRIKPFEMWERTVRPDGTMICRWVMPYENEGEIRLLNLGKTIVNAKVAITTNSWNWNSNSMHFYATWRMDEPKPTFPLYDWNFLEATGKGVIVGDQWTVLNPVEGWWGEGDEKIYIDEDFSKNFPSHFGTGTEDYYGWAGGVVPTPADEFSKPFVGNIIVGEQRSKGYNVCSRTRVLDAIPFHSRIRFDVEASCGKRQRSHYLQYSQTTFWYGSPGIKHNRKSLPDMAAAKLPVVEDLEKLIAIAKQEQYVVDGAIEAEILPTVNKSAAVVENFADIPMWGEMSDGAMKNIWFEKTGDYVEIKLTEQFENSELLLCAAVGPHNGTFNILVNGQLKTTQDLYANHAGMTNPYIELGECEPVNNAFTIRFEYTGSNGKARRKRGKYAMGLDFFLVKNNFLNR